MRNQQSNDISPKPVGYEYSAWRTSPNALSHLNVTFVISWQSENINQQKKVKSGCHSSWDPFSDNRGHKNNGHYSRSVTSRRLVSLYFLMGKG
jgi:hypothetical protein